MPQDNYSPEFYEEEIDLSDYWRALKRRKWTMALVFFAVLFTVTVYSVLKVPVYRASATIFIDQESSNVLTISDNNLAMGGQNYATYKEYFESQKELLRSRGVMEQVYNEFAARLGRSGEPVDATPRKDHWASGVKDFVFGVREALTGRPAERPQEFPVQADPVSEFSKAVKVQDIRGTRLLKLNVEDRDPVLASDIANRIAQIYVDRNLVYISKSEILALHKNEFLKLEARQGELSKIYKENHPQIIRLKQKMDAVVSRIRQERDNIAADGEPAIAAFALAGLKANNISVQEWAVPNFNPVKPDRRRNILLGIFLGLFAALGLVLFQEALDNSIKSQEDIQRLIDWPFLGYIPVFRKGGKEFDQWSHSKPKSVVAEAYRTVRTGLVFSSTQEKPIRTLLLTSPGQQEGKTTTVSNLAIVMAQNQKKVLLVDADMRKPRLHHVYHCDNHTGLSAFLSGQARFEETLSKTEVDNLTFCPCGPHPPNPSELLASRKMEEFITRAKEQFDYIFFDTPPAMVVTDAAVLSRVVDGTVIVLESGKTSRKSIPQLKQSLENAKARVVGLLINKIRAQSGDYQYYSKYNASYYGEKNT